MAGLRSSTVRAGLPIRRRTYPLSIGSAACRLLRKSAPQQSLWTAWTSLVRPTSPTGQSQHQKRTCDVLRRPDIFTCYRQVAALLSELLPISGAQNAGTVRNRTLRVGEKVVPQCPIETARPPTAPADGPVVVGLDGGYVRSRHRPERHFEVVAGKVID